MDPALLRSIIPLASVITGIAIWLIIGLIAEGPLVLLAAILPSKIPVGCFVVVVIHLILLLGCTPLLTWFVADMNSEEFIAVFRFTGVGLTICAAIGGLLTYLGTRTWIYKIWQGPKPDKYFFLPLRVSVSGGLVLLGWILLSGGMITPLLLIAMMRQ